MDLAAAREPVDRLERDRPVADHRLVRGPGGDDPLVARLPLRVQRRVPERVRVAADLAPVRGRLDGQLAGVVAQDPHRPARVREAREGVGEAVVAGDDLLRPVVVEVGEDVAEVAPDVHERRVVLGRRHVAVDLAVPAAVRAAPVEVEHDLGLAVAVDVGDRDRALVREVAGRLGVEAAARRLAQRRREALHAVARDRQPLPREAEGRGVVAVGEDRLDRAGPGALDVRPRGGGGGRHDDRTESEERDGKRCGGSHAAVIASKAEGRHEGALRMFQRTPGSPLCGAPAETRDLDGARGPDGCSDP